MEFIIGLCIRAGLACIPASIADKKGYSYALFWCLSFFLSFLIVLIVALCITDKYNETDFRPVYSGRRCRYCGAYIGRWDDFCKTCGANQAAAYAGESAPAQADASGEEVKSYSIRNQHVSGMGFISCPNCGERQRYDRDTCFKCGVKFTH